MPTENIWPHLISTVLPGYVWRTLVLMAGVGVITFIVGTAVAWLVTMCRFPLRPLFLWASLLPMAMPDTSSLMPMWISSAIRDRCKHGSVH